MNRYGWEGVARDLAAGRSVVYVGSGRACRAAFERIAALGKPTLFVMEGGYAVAEIGINAVNVLSEFERRA